MSGRFLIKPPPAPPRKDQHLPHVILSEQRNIHAAAHQVGAALPPGLARPLARPLNSLNPCL